MEREIKFRCWHKITKHYFYVSHIENGTNVQSKISILEQYTGLTDKNGTDIYDGDIIKIHSPCIDKSLPWKEPTFKRVGWHTDGFWNLFKDMTDEHKGFNGILNSNLQYYTVIGNINENSELLKSTE